MRRNRKIREDSGEKRTRAWSVVSEATERIPVSLPQFPVFDPVTFSTIISLLFDELLLHLASRTYILS